MGQEQSFTVTRVGSLGMCARQHVGRSELLPVFGWMLGRVLTSLSPPHLTYREEKAVFGSAWVASNTGAPESQVQTLTAHN